MVLLALFRDRNFSGTSFSIVLLSFTAGGLLLALTQYLQFVPRHTLLKAGLALIPYAASAMLFNGLGATLGKKLTLIDTDRDRAGGDLGGLSGSSPGQYDVRLRAADRRAAGDGCWRWSGPTQRRTPCSCSRCRAEHRGAGSANMNDTVQQTGAALSVAVLGSVLAAAYSSSRCRSRSRKPLASPSPRLSPSVRTSSPPPGTPSPTPCRLP